MFALYQRLCLISKLLIWTPVIICASQLSDTGPFRRCGHQGAIVNNRLWLDGGNEVLLSTSISASGSVADPNVTLIDLSTTFEIPNNFSFSELPKPSNVPKVSYGTLWSNEIDTYWQYGGQSIDGGYNNTVWRFVLDQNNGTWSELDLEFLNLTDPRPVNGAGCNVPSHSTGYYLGGQSVLNGTNNNESLNQVFFHAMAIFDMEAETLKVIDVPEYVPVIGHSLVFFETGAEGILVSVGGMVEIDGVLSPASLAQVYVYDISSSSWYKQQTTDTLGYSNFSYGAYDEYAPGIPNERYHFCAVAATAADRTSWNIYVFGGQNDTSTPGDIWALSFPSAIWIRMNTTDITNNPKTSSSCNLINGRYVIMGDGCWFGLNNACLSYGWNPLIYDLSQGDWAWVFDPTIEGYYIPQQIYTVIGGSEYGGAKSTVPMYTNFSSPVIAAAFTFPSDKETKMVLTILNALPACLIGAAALLCAGKASFPQFGKAILGQSPKPSQARERNWKSETMSTPFLIVVAVSTVALIITIRFLWSVSASLDPDPTHWSGGISSEGIWSGEQYASAFTPAAGEGRPFKGLVSFYMDTKESGTWDRKNAIQRLGIPLYILWNYVPIFITVLYGFLWQMIDGEVKRVEKYYQLSREEGCPGKRSLCLDYHCFWSPLSIFQALRYRQWAVALSSTGYTLAVIVIPNIQNYAFTWIVYSGGNVNWGGVYSWQVGYIDPYWSKVLIGIFTANLTCVLALIVMLYFRDSGLQENPTGIVNLINLISEIQHGPAEFGLGDEHSVASLEKITSELDSQIFCISPEYRLRIQSPPQPGTSQQKVHIPWDKILPGTIMRSYSKFWEATRPKLESMQKFISTLVQNIDRWITDRPQSFMFNPWVISCWILFLVVLLAANSYILFGMLRPGESSLSNYGIPWSPDVYLIVGVFAQSIFQVVDRNVRATSVLDTLRQGFQPAEILWADYTSGTPIIEIYTAFRNGEHLLGYVMLASLATIVYTIMIGSLQASASFYGATDFNGDLSSVVVSLMMNLFILIVSIAVTCSYCSSKKFPRYPGTIASLLPYVLSSELLIGDVEDAMKAKGRSKQIEELQKRGRRYGFGMFENRLGDGVLHLGVERNYCDGPDGEEHVKLWVKT